MSNGSSHGEGTGTASSPSSLPDINTQTYPFDVVLYQLDQAVSFNICVTADQKRSDGANPDDAFGVNGGCLLATPRKIHPLLSGGGLGKEKGGGRGKQTLWRAPGTFPCRLIVRSEHVS